MTLVDVRRKGKQHVTYVESDQDAGKEYEIARLPGGNLACACHAYVFNRATPKTCKHIEAFEAGHVGAMAMIARADETTRRREHKGETFTFKRAISFKPI